MSGRDDSLVEDRAEKKEEIHIADQEMTLESEESRIQIPAQTFNFDDIRKVLSADEQLLDGITKAKIIENIGGPMIQKVPEIMLQNGNLIEYFKPRELSIGPIHASDPNLFKLKLKLKLAAYFFRVNQPSGKYLLGKFKLESKDIKKDFDEEVTKSYTDEELIRLLLLDGSAMLGFIESYGVGNLNIFNISNGQARLIQQDLFLLENQIPFKVLKELIFSSQENQRMYLQRSLVRFINTISIVPKGPREVVYIARKRFWDSRTQEPYHVLDLQRRFLSTSTPTHEFGSLIPFIRSFFYVIFFALGALICYVICCVMERSSESRQFPRKYWNKIQTFRNVQELKSAGIKFKPTDCLRSIFFHSQFFIRGQLLLPTLVVDDSTERMLLNLVACEMCLTIKETTDHEPEDPNEPWDQDDRYWVTSYVNLLDLLIDNEQDVKDLRAAGILQNRLSSDIEAAQLINRIGSYCFASPKDNYERVKVKIERHYRRRCAIWTTQVCHTHFSSPWTILALLAATAILGLTAVQTYYAVNPKR